jgi:hypothetical protein
MPERYAADVRRPAPPTPAATSGHPAGVSITVALDLPWTGRTARISLSIRSQPAATGAPGATNGMLGAGAMPQRRRVGNPPAASRADAVYGAAGARVAVPEIAHLMLDAFAVEGNPGALTVARLADRLAVADPATWGRWTSRADQLALVGRTLQHRLRQAGLTVPTTRLDNAPGRPTAYRLADIHAAVRRIGAAP